MTTSSIFTSLSNFRGIIAFVGVLKWIGFHVWVVHHWFGMELVIATWDCTIATILLIIASLVLINSLHYMPRTAKFWAVLGLSLCLAIFCSWLTNQVLFSIAQENEAYIAFLHKAVPVRSSLNFLVIAGASVASVFYFQWVEQEAQSKHEAATASMVREAELQKLQQQLQPHFLFNCLNSINAMIILKPEEAKKMVQHLSDFLRITLKRADEHWITLAEEWTYLQLYLDIEKVRFGHRLEVNTGFDEASKQWIMPTLLLQPLVENAIKHGLYGTTEKVTIEIKSEVRDQLLVIQIINPYDTDGQTSNSTRFGLSGLKRRLYLLFAHTELLETRTNENKFTVTLKIPLRP